MRVFYDLTCPYCYLAQPYNEHIRLSGVDLIELPFQAHPEIPLEGKFIGPRHGLMYDEISARARTLNLPLRLGDVLPNSRMALAVAEWVRVNQPGVAGRVRERLFHAHFARALDLGSTAVLLGIAAECGVRCDLLERALNSGEAVALVLEFENLAKDMGVMGTPAWESNGTIISGLQEAELSRLVEQESKIV